MNIVNLYSGSKGNCTYVNMMGKHILIDVGWNYKNLNESLLINVGIEVENIDAILITHAHSDHISSLPVILKHYPDMRVITTENIYANILDKSKLDVIDNIVFIDKKRYSSIRHFDLKHDSDCVGYILYDKNESFCFISDNGGYIKRDDLTSYLRNHTWYSIESNYDETMQYLDTTRHTGLKRRVLGAYGHTSNVQAINNASQMVGDNTKGIIFTHLSSHCNTIELAYDTHANYIEVWGHKNLFKNIKISYALEKECVVLNGEN